MTGSLMLGDALALTAVALAIIATMCVDGAARWMRACGMSPPPRPLGSIGRTLALLREYRCARLQQGRASWLVSAFWLTVCASLVCFGAAFWTVLG